jgi:hypothetical protein
VASRLLRLEHPELLGPPKVNKWEDKAANIAGSTAASCTISFFFAELTFESVRQGRSSGEGVGEVIWHGMSLDRVIRDVYDGATTLPQVS